MVPWKESDRKKTMKTLETREMKGSIANYYWQFVYGLKSPLFGLDKTDLKV